MDINTLIQIIVVIVQAIIAVITLISVVLIYKTIKTNQSLNQKILFDRITKEERELRIKFQEYREKINNRKISKKEKETLIFTYETLLFNYYEYLAICLFRSLIDEKDAKLYFKELLVSVKKIFESSLLFKMKAAQKEEYKGVQWLFKKWGI